jgi:hypothetical protein
MPCSDEGPWIWRDPSLSCFIEPQIAPPLSPERVQELCAQTDELIRVAVEEQRYGHQKVRPPSPATTLLLPLSSHR